MSEVLEITGEDRFDDAVAESAELVVRFTAPWCAPCRQLAPHMERAAEERPDTNFVYVDIDEAPWAVARFGIQSVPQVMLYRDGEYVKHLTGRTVVQILSELA